MNKAASHYHYFSRVELDLEELVTDKEEEFDLWMAEKMMRYTSNKDLNSEAAKKRQLMVDYKNSYETKNKEIRELKNFQRQAEIAKKALEKYMNLVSSIGAMVRSGNPESSPTSGIGD